MKTRLRHLPVGSLLLKCSGVGRPDVRNTRAVCSVARLQRLRHLGKEPLQRGLNHHFGEGVEVRIAAHLTRGTLTVGLDVDFKLNLTGVGAWVINVNTVPVVALLSDVLSK